MHPHELVLAFVDLKAAVRREGRVEETERVREPHLLDDLDLVAAPNRHRRRRPLAGPVDSEDRGLFER